VLRSTVSTPASAADPPVVPPQRHALPDELNRRWRVTIDRLTELSIELHGFGDDVPPERVALVEARLAAARRSLVEIETSLQRLRVAAISTIAG